MTIAERVLVAQNTSSAMGFGVGENLALESEQARVERIRRITPPDLVKILEWASDQETRRHLDPAPDVPENWGDRNQVVEAVNKLKEYYNNFGEPRKILPVVAANPDGMPMAVLTLRWRGDPLVPRGRGIASIERLIVDPKMRRMGIGQILAASAIEFAFNGYQGYDGKGASEIRAWIMTDQQAGDWLPNWHFFLNLGFRVTRGDSRHWSDFAKQREIITDRDALWLNLKREDWEELKGEKPALRRMIKSLE